MSSETPFESHLSTRARWSSALQLIVTNWPYLPAPRSQVLQGPGRPFQRVCVWALRQQCEVGFDYGWVPQHLDAFGWFCTVGKRSHSIPLVEEKRQSTSWTSSHFPTLPSASITDEHKSRGSQHPANVFWTQGWCTGCPTTGEPFLPAQSWRQRPEGWNTYVSERKWQGNKWALWDPSSTWLQEERGRGELILVGQVVKGSRSRQHILQLA